MTELEAYIRGEFGAVLGADAADKPGRFEQAVRNLVGLFGSDRACPDCRWRKAIANGRENHEETRREYETALRRVDYLVTEA